MIKRLAPWAAIVFVAFYLVTEPVGAANFVRSVLNGLASAGDALAQFLNTLA